ncbi:MAG: 16S rRNA (guanine(966)-N(2))-methyltransferase RsmD [Pseudomonas fluorescens]|nr:MAG: 16S rRNA (guanine(966)-N(2))-methyltransferase RsmD [Pseudomonas fluorescens]
MANNVFYDHIIAGSLKGRKVVLPKSDGVRPSKNRVKQAVFNLLGARVEWEGAVVLDLFCGSGAWGLEALSRGAKSVICVDVDERVAAENIKSMGASGCKAVSADVRLWKPPALADVVLLDPPYGKSLAQAVVKRAGEFGKSGSWWCVETGTDDEIIWDGFEDVKFRDYGASRVWIALKA